MPIRFTARDEALLSTLARFRYMTYDQLARTSGRTESEMRRRMPQLAAEGLVRKEPFGFHRISVWFLTADGMDYTGLDLKVAKGVNPVVLAHTLAIGQVALYYEQAGWTVISEREIRRDDLRDRQPRSIFTTNDPTRFLPRYALQSQPDRSRLNSRTGRLEKAQWLHIPDFIAIGTDADGNAHRRAVEIELSMKSPSRVRDTLWVYQANNTNVEYWTDTVQIRDLINTAAIQTSTTNLVTIRKFTPTDPIHRQRDCRGV